MKRSTRLLIALVLVEAILAGIAWWLLERIADGTLQPATSAAETISTITTAIGAAMGGIAGLVGVAWLVLRLKNR